MRTKQNDFFRLKLQYESPNNRLQQLIYFNFRHTNRLYHERDSSPVQGIILQGEARMATTTVQKTAKRKRKMTEEEFMRLSDD